MKGMKNRYNKGEMGGLGRGLHVKDRKKLYYNGAKGRNEGWKEDL